VAGRSNTKTREEREREAHSAQPGANGELPEGAVLLDYANSPPKPEDTLLGNRWLCRKGMGMLVGPSGRGKSSFTLQTAIHWSIGLPFLGIKPSRPLKIIIFGCEDDAGDIYEIIRDACHHLKLLPEQTVLCRKNCRYYHYTEKSGLHFLTTIVDPVLNRDRPDLMLINPLLGYVGGDVRNPEITGPFLRNSLLPILDKYNVGAFIMHHTPKTNFRTTGKWSSVDWQYAAAGNADLTNAMRCILVLEPTALSHVFRLMAPKRGQRVGWEDDYGHTQFEQFVAWEKDSIWWRAATPQEIREAKTVKKEKAPAEDVFDLVPESGDIWKEELIALVVEHFDVSETTAKKRINQLIARRKLTERLVPRPGNRPAVYLSRTTKNDDQ
jgi:AAA domain